MGATLELRKSDHGKVFEVRQGDDVLVLLPENPTTGYLWAAVPTEFEFISLISSSFEPGTDAAIGGGGIRRFVFIAETPGQVRMHFELRRPWESGEPAIDGFTASLVIR